MAPTNITFRVNINGKFHVHDWGGEMTAVDRENCCFVMGDFNAKPDGRWWIWDRDDMDPDSFRMRDDDGDGVYEATIEIPEPPDDAQMWSASQLPSEILGTRGWRVLSSTANYRYKVATFHWWQQELFGLGEAPLPDDASCLLGPVWDGAPTAPHTRAAG